MFDTDDDVETKSQQGDQKQKTKASRASSYLLSQNSLLSSLKTNLTKLKSKSPEEVTNSWLKSKRTLIVEEMETSSKFHKIILTKSSESEVATYLERNTYSDINDYYCDLIAEIDGRLGDTEVQIIKEANGKSKQFMDLRLPRIDLPNFTGKYDEWLPFHNLFTSTVHNRQDLEPVQKFHYLLKSVTDDAYNQIKNLPVTNESYQTALDILNKQYNHKRQVANTYLKRLLEFNTTLTENADDFKKFLSTITDCMFSLKQLGLPVDSWDYLLLYILQPKLPKTTYWKWKEELGSSRDIPTLNQFLEFLEERYRTLEMEETPNKDLKKPFKALHIQTNKPSNQHTNRTKFKRNQPISLQSQRSYRCALCKGTHSTSRCTKFLNNTADTRHQLAIRHKMCLNCLGSSHTADSCYSTKTCIYCNQRHHTLLHRHEKNTHPRVNSVENPLSGPSHEPRNFNPRSQPFIPTANVLYASTESTKIKVLGTALVNLINSNGYSTTMRVLLDSGAEENYITTAAVQNSNLKRYSAPSAITGLNNINVGTVDYKVNFKVQSLDGSFQYDTCASVVENITSRMPSQRIPTDQFGFLNDLQLADPDFHKPGKIQLLLGIEFIVKIKQLGLKRFNNFLAEQTSLGWVITGQATLTNTVNQMNQHLFFTKPVSNEDLSHQIQKFFESEEFSENIPEKPEDVECERKFVTSIKRCTDGKLLMDLPFREDTEPIIGPSRHIALRRFLNLEKKLDQNLVLKKEYCDTITDYLKCGHLSLSTVASTDGLEYFLPHHAVVKESSTTTKVRVVFDGSCKSSDYTSLNDHLLTGAKLQKDIRDVFFNWRNYKYALTADIAKMYRMFWISERHRPYQKILWRFDKSQPITEYSLNTVTFGTKSAPFQAMRALKYIATEEISNFPLASKALGNDFYVDDYISGAHTVSQAVEKQTQLRHVLNQYGLTIRKWSSNNVNTLKDIPTEHQETLTELSFEEEEFRKTLGVFWAPKGDYFSFSTNNFTIDNNKLTKRLVLSMIARLYDPVGWVSPSILHAKLIMQNIWELKIDWDEEVCGHVKVEFEKFLSDLPKLTKVKIPRWTNITDDFSPVTIYGFSDASLKAYGAVLYLKNPDVTDSKKLILLTSRTRVKPLKHTTLARLELCAAVLLSELIKWATTLFSPRKVEIKAFTDSQIVLSWINAHPSRWKMYVASRTTKILENLKANQWAYVNTKYNPADLTSRGLLPSELVESSLWWNGPPLDILHNNIITEDLLTNEDATIIQGEAKEKVILHTVQNKNTLLSVIEKYSSHTKTCRIIKHVLNFLCTLITKLKARLSHTIRYETLLNKFAYPENQICRLVQSLYYLPEIKALQSDHDLPKASNLHSLSPFLDVHGVLRVGGRLENASITYNQKHPIILPANHQVSINLIDLAHKTTMHGGNKITGAYLRNKFHVVRGAERIKKMIRQCPRCIRFARYTHEQLMGSLPTDRVQLQRPFLNTGVDYAGPFTLKAYKGRCKVMIKHYVALFVCLGTKAIHLELVSSLTATAFLAAFKRFVNRRGRCQKLYSDCGTNFVKGNKLLTAEIQNAQKTWKSELIIDFENLGTQWEFNPPGAPHFGGLWEAGVKSMKTHLYKTLQNALLSIEEFNTVLIQIEAILNSRPLCTVPENPTDFIFLTPSHFLIGESIIAPPERVYNIDGDMHPLDRWQHLQKLRQMFWMTWKQDYLHQLNSRSKWKTAGRNFEMNDLVILTDENTPPTYWPIAKILKVHPGRDGKTRVVTILTSKGQTFKRPISKLRLLPFDKKQILHRDFSSV